LFFVVRTAETFGHIDERGRNDDFKGHFSVPLDSDSLIGNVELLPNAAGRVVENVGVAELSRHLLRSFVTQLNGFALKQLDISGTDDDSQRFGTRHFATAFAVFSDDGDGGAADQVVATVAHEVVVFAVESAVVRVAIAPADGVALVLRALPRTVRTRALVAVASDHAAFFEVFGGLAARALAGRNAFAVVQHLTLGTTATFNAFDVLASTLPVAASGDAARPAVVVNLTRRTPGRTEVFCSPSSCSFAALADAFSDQSFEGATSRVGSSFFAIPTNRLYAGLHEIVSRHHGSALGEVAGCKLGAGGCGVIAFLFSVAVRRSSTVVATGVSDFVVESEFDGGVGSALSDGSVEIVARITVVITAQSAHLSFEAVLGDFDGNELLLVPTQNEAQVVAHFHHITLLVDLHVLDGVRHGVGVHFVRDLNLSGDDFE